MAQQTVDRNLWRQHIRYLEKFLARPSHADEAARLDIKGRLERARKALEEAESELYLKQLIGGMGAEPIARYVTHPKG